MNTKQEPSLNCVLAVMSTKMLTLGLYKRRGKYCRIRLAGDNSILVFEEDNLDTKGMKKKHHETLQSQGYVDAELYLLLS